MGGEEGWGGGRARGLNRPPLDIYRSSAGRLKLEQNHVSPDVKERRGPGRHAFGLAALEDDSGMYTESVW